MFGRSKFIASCFATVAVVPIVMGAAKFLDESEQNPAFNQNFGSNSLEISYVKDNRTGLCFAFRSPDGKVEPTSTLTNVPCNSAVIALTR